MSPEGNACSFARNPGSTFGTGGKTSPSVERGVAIPLGDAVAIGPGEAEAAGSGSAGDGAPCGSVADGGACGADGAGEAGMAEGPGLAASAIPSSATNVTALFDLDRRFDGHSGAQRIIRELAVLDRIEENAYRKALGHLHEVPGSVLRGNQTKLVLRRG